MIREAAIRSAKIGVAVFIAWCVGAGLAACVSRALAARPPEPPARQGFELVGYHASPLMRAWAAESLMPLPQVRVWIDWGGPVSPWGSHEIDLPGCCTQGWTHLAIHGLLLHELGHIFDRTNMDPALRAEFRALAGFPAGWNWWAPYPTVRWVVSATYIVKLPPGEAFAEEYAACSLGLSQLGYQAAGYNSYGWVPPEGDPGADAAICGLIERAARRES